MSEWYEIKLQGRLSERWAEHFTPLHMTLLDEGATLLHGAVADQAQLFGLLQRVRDLNSTLLYPMPWSKQRRLRPACECLRSEAARARSPRPSPNIGMPRVVTLEPWTDGAEILAYAAVRAWRTGCCGRARASASLIRLDQGRWLSLGMMVVGVKG